MLRRLLLAGLAALVAATFLLAAAEAKAPPRHRSRLPHVSAGVPYIAPWQSGFRRYSTQLLDLANPGATSISALIPEGQWWRVIFMEGQVSDSAVAGTRTIGFQVLDASGIPYTQQAPLTLDASQAGTFIFGPHLSGYAVTLPVASQMAVASLPDVLWPPKSTIRLIIQSAKAGDQFATSAARLAVEVYTPEKEGSALLVPTPLHV